MASACRAQSSAGEIILTMPPFSADPTGRRDSTAAFQRASRAINAASGGRLVIPPGRYRIGIQSASRSPDWSFGPAEILTIRNCRTPVEIIGTGATLFATEGLRYGSFDPANGRPFHRQGPLTDRSYRASPYWAIIGVYSNSAPVTIDGVELDGRISDAVLGGGWNDTGIQIGNSGIEAYDNADLTVRNVYSHHNGLDGIQIGYRGLTSDQELSPHRLIDCRFEDNGRQGLSWVGGNSLTVSNCTFLRSGRGPVASNPAAGVDIEPENSICVNARFDGCTFSDNAGVGMLAHLSGRCENHLFTDCRFVGTTSWSAWPAAPISRFEGCTFVGGVTNAHADSDPRRATQFVDCLFTASADQSPTGRVYAQNYLTVEMDSLRNVRFDHCRFDSGNGQAQGLIYANGGLFENCEFLQRRPGLAVLRGIFRGRNAITTAGTVEKSGAQVIDSLTVNGRPVG